MKGRVVPLGSIMARRSGSVDPARWPNETFELYSIPAFDAGTPLLVAGHAIGSTKQIVRANDVLLSRIIPHIRRAWVVGPNDKHRQIASGEWIVFRSDRVHPQYLRQLLVTDRFHAQFMKTVAGVGGSLLRARPSRVAAINIQLPPLPEQRRIADILDQANAVRAKRREALAQMQALTQSMFLDMFGDPETNPRRWAVSPVSEYVASFQGGRSIEADPDSKAPARNRLLKVSAVTTMAFLPGEAKPAPDWYEPPAGHFVRPGDLLFSRANTSALVGAVALVDQTPNNLLLPDKLWRFVWREPMLVEPLFIWALFQTASFRRKIVSRATGTSGSMKNISQEKLMGIRSILPPLALQRQFARHLARAQELRLRMAESTRQLDVLLASLQYRAFVASRE